MLCRVAQHLYKAAHPERDEQQRSCTCRARVLEFCRTAWRTTSGRELRGHDGRNSLCSRGRTDGAYFEQPNGRPKPSTCSYLPSSYFGQANAVRSWVVVLVS